MVNMSHQGAPPVAKSVRTVMEALSTIACLVMIFLYFQQENVSRTALIMRIFIMGHAFRAVMPLLKLGLIRAWLHVNFLVEKMSTCMMMAAVFSNVSCLLLRLMKVGIDIANSPVKRVSMHIGMGRALKIAKTHLLVKVEKMKTNSVFIHAQILAGITILKMTECVIVIVNTHTLWIKRSQGLMNAYWILHNLTDKDTSQWNHSKMSQWILPLSKCFSTSSTWRSTTLPESYSCYKITKETPIPSTLVPKSQHHSKRSSKEANYLKILQDTTNQQISSSTSGDRSWP